MTAGTCVANCGNGVTDTNETCDDGDAISLDGCSSICQIETGYTCIGTPSSCTLLCGNGAINAGEGCDDGNNVSSDGCSSLCVVETGYTCTGAPSNCTYGGGGSPTSCPSYCLSLGYHGIPEGSCRQNANTCINFEKHVHHLCREKLVVVEVNGVPGELRQILVVASLSTF